MTWVGIMLYNVRASTGGFGVMGVVVEGAADALQRAEDLEQVGALSITIVDPLGVEYDLPTFRRVTGTTGLTKEHLALVQGTSDVLLSNNTRVAEIFYDRLFELAPEVRPLFAKDLAGQKEKLRETLVSVIGLLTGGEAFGRAVTGLGRRHSGYGAERGHYGPVGAALLASLADLLGERFTTEVQAAWTALYVHVSEMMIGAQEADRRG